MPPVCYEGIWPVEELSATGEQCLNCLSQPRGPPQNVAYDANRTIFANRGTHYSGTYLDTYWFFDPTKGKDPVNHNNWNTSTYNFQGTNWYFERYISPKVPKKK